MYDLGNDQVTTVSAEVQLVDNTDDASNIFDDVVNTMEMNSEAADLLFDPAFNGRYLFFYIKLLKTSFYFSGLPAIDAGLNINNEMEHLSNDIGKETEYHVMVMGDERNKEHRAVFIEDGDSVANKGNITDLEVIGGVAKATVIDDLSVISDVDGVEKSKINDGLESVGDVVVVVDGNETGVEATSVDSQAYGIDGNMMENESKVKRKKRKNIDKSISPNAQKNNTEPTFCSPPAWRLRSSKRIQEMIGNKQAMMNKGNNRKKI